MLIRVDDGAATAASWTDSDFILTSSPLISQSQSPSQPQPSPGHKPPEIVKTETFHEGQLVFFRLYYTDPDNDATGFGFRGAQGAAWAQEEHLFSDPSYVRWSPGKIEYPFNLACGTGSEYQSDVAAWIYDADGHHSSEVTIHLACSAPNELDLV